MKGCCVKGCGVKGCGLNGSWREGCVDEMREGDKIWVWLNRYTRMVAREL